MKLMFKAAATILLYLLSTASASAAMPGEADLSAAVTAYRQALVQKDLKALDGFWLTDYTFVNGQGAVQTKADRMASLQSGATSLSRITSEVDPLVRVYGEIGIVTSRVTIVGRYSGKEVAHDFRSTHIWRYSDGRWRLLMNQLTEIAK